MSETDKNPDDKADADFDEEATQEPADDEAERESVTDETDTDAAPDEAPVRRTDEGAPDIVITRKSGASALVAWLALFLALVTVAGVGYLGLEKWRADRAAAEEDAVVSALTARLEAADSTLDELSESLSQLAAAESRANDAIVALRDELDDRSQLFDSLPPRMTSLERSIAALQGVSLDARNTYLIAEAEYYMQIANAQLQLAGNPYLASLALAQADDRLLQLADPGLTDVRRAIADERAALDVMEKPDIAGVTLTLSSLARVAEALPLRSAARDEADDVTDDGETPGGAARAWNAVKGAFTGLVEHTPPGELDAPLLTPDAEPLIRSNLSLQLQAARLALLRGEQPIFDESLDDAAAWLRTYFDTSSEPVSSALTTLAEIREQYAVSAPPDISGSLRLLRQYKALTEPDE